MQSVAWCIRCSAGGWLIFFGLESIERRLYLLMLIGALGLAGLSQSFWRSRLGPGPHAKADLISFYIGLSAAIVFPFLVTWNLLNSWLAAFAFIASSVSKEI